jgi:hypothetical protein
MNKLILPLISDSGHSWMKVDNVILQELNIFDRLTPYSPKLSEFSYLEEDVDMTMFLNEAKKAGYELDIRELDIEDFDAYLESLEK